MVYFWKHCMAKISKGKSKGIAYSSSQTCLTTTETRVPHGITQCYLPPGRGDILTFTPADVCLYSIQQSLSGARLSWLSWLGYIPRWYIPARRRTPISVLTGLNVEYNLFMRRTTLNRVPALIGWGKGWNVTSARWQVTLCDPIWHVSSRSSEAFANCYIRLL